MLASRAACRDAHEYTRIDEKSPLVARRIEDLGLEEDEGVLNWIEGLSARGEFGVEGYG